MISAHELEALFHELVQLEGRRLRFKEQISRSRQSGTNRHHTTTSSFSMRVENVVCAFSGWQLMFKGEGFSYGIAADSIDSYEIGEGFIEIVEHFEKQTERRTRITIRDEN